MAFPLQIALLDYHCAVAKAMRRQSPLMKVPTSPEGTARVLQFPPSPVSEGTAHGSVKEEPTPHSQPELKFEDIEPDCQHSSGSGLQDEMSIYKPPRFTEKQDCWLWEITHGEPHDMIDWQYCAEQFLGTFQEARDGQELNLEYLRLGLLKIEAEKGWLMREFRPDAIGTGMDSFSNLDTTEVGEGESTGEAMTSLVLDGTADDMSIVGDPKVLDGPFPSCASDSTIPDAGSGDSMSSDSSEQIGNATEGKPLEICELSQAVDEVPEKPDESTEKTSSMEQRSPGPAQFPRILHTKAVTNTLVAMIAMRNAAPTDLQPSTEIHPHFQYSELAHSLMQFLTTLLSQPLDREIRIICDSRLTITSLTAQAENTDKRVWLCPTPGFIRRPIGPNGELEIQDLIHEILLTVDARIRDFGCRTWLQYDE